MFGVRSWKIDPYQPYKKLVLPQHDKLEFSVKASDVARESRTTAMWHRGLQHRSMIWHKKD